MTVVSKNDPIAVKSRGTVQQRIDHATAAGAVDAPAFLLPLDSFCKTEEIDATVLAAQWEVETATGTSARWRSNHNPAGLAIVKAGDPDPGDWTPKQAAAVHVSCVLIALRRTAKSPDLQTVTNSAPGATVFLERWRAKYAAPQCPPVVAINDLCAHYDDASGEPQATWAWDLTYGTQIAQHATEILAMPIANPTPAPVPGALTFGLVPKPPFIKSYVTDDESAAYDILGMKIADGVVWHRMEGTLRGTDGWFKRGRGVSDGLTEFGIGNLTTDGAALDGVIFIWNPPLGEPEPGVSANRAPWASGPVSGAYGDGLAFLQDHNNDLNVVNRNEAAIEVAGNYNDPVSQKAIDSLVWLTAYFADQKKIPWDVFPIIPGKIYSFVRWHQEYCIGTGKECPGAVLMNLTNQLIELIRALLKKWQTGAVVVPTPLPTPKPTKYPTPHPTIEESINVIPYVATLTVLKPYQPRLVASEHGQATADLVPLIDPKTGKPSTIRTKWLRTGADGEIWYETKGGSRHPRWAFFLPKTNKA